MEIQKQRRKVRALVAESPEVVDAFSRMRRAENEENLRIRRLAEEENVRTRNAAKAIADRNNAFAELKKAKRSMIELESRCACKHALKTYTLDSLGAGSPNAGGAKGKKNRFEVLDRLAQSRAGLSPGQRNDWAGFKENWDNAMIGEHGEDWGRLFAGWMQGVLEDEHSNAFSIFMYKESVRVIIQRRGGVAFIIAVEDWMVRTAVAERTAVADAILSAVARDGTAVADSRGLVSGIISAVARFER